jgi:hypothetical protein
MRTRVILKRIAAVTMLVACLTMSLAFAQLDPGDCRIYQNGVQVGEIYVPGWSSQSLYVEHWILYPNYVYPNARNGIKTEIIRDTNASYTSETDFFARAPFGPGYRYVRVTSNDTDRMPGRN